MSFTVKVVQDTKLRGLDDLLKRLPAGKSTVLVGIPEGATRPDGTSLALTAAANEFGVDVPGRPVIPERPAFRRAIGRRRNRAMLKALQAASIQRIARGRLSAGVALGLLGQAGAALVKDEIRNGRFTPLAPSTVAAKGDDKTLIETGQEVGAVTYRIESKP